MKQQISCELTLIIPYIYFHKPLFSSLDQKVKKSHFFKDKPIFNNI